MTLPHLGATLREVGAAAAAVVVVVVAAVVLEVPQRREQRGGKKKVPNVTFIPSFCGLLVFLP